MMNDECDIRYQTTDNCLRIPNSFSFFKIWCLRVLVVDFVFNLLLFFPRKKRSKSPAVRDAAQFFK